MTGPTSARWRAVRTAVFAVVASGLAALGHVVGGGDLPDPAVLLIGTMAIGGTVSGLTRTQRTGPQILGLLLIAQVAFHLLFGLVTHAAGPEPFALIPMAAFHLVAALVTTVVLATGEDTLFRLFAALTRVVLRVLPVAPVVAPLRWSVVPAADFREPARAAAVALLPRRGPPFAH